MPKLVNRVPAYSRHKSSGQAIVKFGGKTHYLGLYGSKASRAAYDRIIAEYLAGGRTRIDRQSQVVSVAIVANAYLTFARGYYVKAGKPTKQYENARLAIRFLRPYLKTAADDFGPRSLQAIRQQMIDADLSRRTVNDYVGILKRMFRWATAEELIEPRVTQSLAAVDGLKKGRTTARESAPIQPVDELTVEETVKRLPQVVADMVRLQLLTAMRPQDVCNLRPCDVDRSGDVWLYTPAEHKNTHRGMSRTVFIGPRGQEILLRYLARDPEAHCFSPADSEEKRLAELHAKRKTPKSCGNRPGTNRKRNPKRKPRHSYSTDTYRRAIHRACEKEPELPKWSPKQLRHSAGTFVRKEFGLEAAQLIMGHASADVSQIYAERDLQRAIDVAKKIG